MVKTRVIQILPTFEIEDSFYMEEHIIFTGKSPVDFDEEDNPFPSEILIDGKLYKVLGVDKYMHCSPWHKGEPIGIRVVEIKEEER